MKSKIVKLPQRPYSRGNSVLVIFRYHIAPPVDDVTLCVALMLYAGKCFRLSVKISLLCRLTIKKFYLSQLSVNVSYFFLPLVGSFFFVLWVVSNVLPPFVASLLTPFTPSWLLRDKLEF